MHLATGNNGDIADEDMQIIAAVARNLQAKSRFFKVNLGGTTVLTNIPEGQFTFSSIDMIMDTHKKIMEIDAQTPHRLVMPTDQFGSRTKIGELLGMDVYADPKCPKDKFLIEQDMEKSS